MSQDSLTLLTQLGFSKGEAVVYAYLLRSSEGQSLEEITVGCGITPEEAEKVLGRAVERGLLRVMSNRFEAVDPKSVLARVLGDRERGLKEELQRLSGVASTLQKSLEPVFWESRLGVRPEELLQSLPDLRAMEARTGEVLQGAQKQVCIFAESFGWYDRIRDELLNALKRGVKIRVLMLVIDKSSAEKARELKKFGAEVRHCAEGWYPARGTLVDDRELVFLIWATEKRGVKRPIHFFPHYTTNPGMIRIFSDAFEKRWEAGDAVA